MLQLYTIDMVYHVYYINSCQYNYIKNENSQIMFCHYITLYDLITYTHLGSVI